MVQSGDDSPMSARTRDELPPRKGVHFTDPQLLLLHRRRLPPSAFERIGPLVSGLLGQLGVSLFGVGFPCLRSWGGRAVGLHAAGNETFQFRTFSRLLHRVFASERAILEQLQIIAFGKENLRVFSKSHWKRDRRVERHMCGLLEQHEHGEDHALQTLVPSEVSEAVFVALVSVSSLQTRFFEVDLIV